MKEIKVNFFKTEEEATFFAQEFANQTKRRVSIITVPNRGFLVAEEKDIK